MKRNLGILVQIHCCGSGVIIETYIGSISFAESGSDSWLKFHKYCIGGYS
jgi:hypothetical protein